MSSEAGQQLETGVAMTTPTTTSLPPSTRFKPVSQMTQEEIAAEARKILLSATSPLSSSSSQHPAAMATNAATTTTTASMPSSSALSSARKNRPLNDSLLVTDAAVYDYNSYLEGGALSGGEHDDAADGKHNADDGFTRPLSHRSNGSATSARSALKRTHSANTPRDTFGDDSRVENNNTNNGSETDESNAYLSRSARRVIVTDEKQYAEEQVEMIDLPLSLALLYQTAYAVQVKQPCENLKKLLLEIALVNGSARLSAEAEAERLRRDACLRLYTQSGSQKEKLDEKRSKIKQQLLESEDKECTFKPTLSQHACEIRREYHTPSGKVDFLKLQAANKEWLKNREKKLSAKALKNETDRVEAIQESIIPMSDKSKKLADRYKQKQEEKRKLEAALMELSAVAGGGHGKGGMNSFMMTSNSSASPTRSVAATAAGLLSPIPTSKSGSRASAHSSAHSPAASQASAHTNNPNKNNSPSSAPRSTATRSVAGSQHEGEGEGGDGEKEGAGAADESMAATTLGEDGDASSPQRTHDSDGGDDEAASPPHHRPSYTEEDEANAIAMTSQLNEFYTSESVSRFLDLSGNVDIDLIKKMQHYRRGVLDDRSNSAYYPSFEPVTTSASAYDRYFKPGNSGSSNLSPSRHPRTPTSATATAAGDGAAAPAEGDDGQTAANARIVQRLLEDVEQRKLRQEQRLKEAEERRKEKLFDPLTGQPFFQPNAVPTIVIGKKRVPITELPPKEREEATKILRNKKLDFLLSVAKKKADDGSPQRDLNAFLKYCDEMQAQAARRMEKIRRIEEKELEGLFVPTVDPRSKKIASQKSCEKIYQRELLRKEPPPPPPPKKESDAEAIKMMMERSKHWEDRRAMLTKKKQNELLKEETKECTFQPKLRARVSMEMTAAAEQRLAGELAMLRSQQELLRIEGEQRAASQNTQRVASRSVQSADRGSNTGFANNYYSAGNNFIESSGSLRRERNVNPPAGNASRPRHEDPDNYNKNVSQQQSQITTQRSGRDNGSFGYPVVESVDLNDTANSRSAANVASARLAAEGGDRTPNQAAATALPPPPPPPQQQQQQQAAEPSIDDLLDSWKELDALTDSILKAQS